jgi:hypothetical protein
MDANIVASAPATLAQRTLALYVGIPCQSALFGVTKMPRI